MKNQYFGDPVTTSSMTCSSGFATDTDQDV
jgi:hypothetical protein